MYVEVCFHIIISHLILNIHSIVTTCTNEKNYRIGTAPREPTPLDDDDALSDGLGIGFCSNVTSQFGLSGLPLLSFIVSYICNCPNPLYATCICCCVLGSSGFNDLLSRNSSWIALYIPHRFFDGYVAHDRRRRRYKWTSSLDCEDIVLMGGEE